MQISKAPHPQINSVFSEFGCERPQNGVIWTAQDGEKLAGFQCLHQVWHGGPVWVAPEYRGKGLWAEMQRTMEASLPKGFGYYQFGTEKNRSQLTRLGLEPLGWEVWLRKVGE